MSDEEWRAVVGWEGLYEVSSHGRVRNIARGAGRSYGKILRTSRKTRYASATLCKGGVPETHTIHRLVGKAFLGKPGNPSQTDVLHWDDNPHHNHVSNLRWGTVGDNIRDAVRNGSYRNQNTGKTHCIRGHRLPESRKCLECRRVWALEKAKTGLPEGDPRHGTLTGYTQWPCRCDICKGAQRAYDSRRNRPRS